AGGQYDISGINTTLAFFDTASGRYLAPVKNFSSYRRSPDGVSAVVSNLDSYAENPFLAIMSALGSRAIFVAPASYNPAWSADGQNFHLLPGAMDAEPPIGAAFSADGQYLAADLLSYQGSRTTAIYSAADERLLRTLPLYGFGGWSPAGHALLLNQTAGSNPS